MFDFIAWTTSDFAVFLLEPFCIRSLIRMRIANYISYRGLSVLETELIPTISTYMKTLQARVSWILSAIQHILLPIWQKGRYNLTCIVISSFSMVGFQRNSVVDQLTNKPVKDWQKGHSNEWHRRILQIILEFSWHNMLPDTRVFPFYGRLMGGMIEHSLFFQILSWSKVYSIISVFAFLSSGIWQSCRKELRVPLLGRVASFESLWVCD